MSVREINNCIIVALGLLVLSLVFFENTNFDVFLQNKFYNFQGHEWIIDAKEPIKRFLFYIFPKILLGIFIATLLVLLILSFKFKIFCNKRYSIIYIFTSLILVLLIAGNIKKFTNIKCPNQLNIYNGNYEYIKFFEKRLDDGKKGKCFPAGHAVTGYSLFVLFFVFANKTKRLIIFYLTFIAGSILGTYQMLKGAHFLSHTIISAIVCFLIAALIAKLFLEKKIDITLK